MSSRMASSSAIKNKSSFSYEELKNYRIKAYRNGNWRKLSFDEKVMYKAALCDTPVLASNIGCLPEVVDLNIGRLVDPPTLENFAKAIEYCYIHHDELERLSRTCAEYAQKHFTESNAKVAEDSYYT